MQHAIAWRDNDKFQMSWTPAYEFTRRRIDWGSLQIDNFHKPMQHAIQRTGNWLPGHLPNEGTGIGVSI